MSGRHPFSELTKDFSEERRRRIKDMKKELRAGMPLHDLRRARELARKFRRLKAGQKREGGDRLCAEE